VTVAGLAGTGITIFAGSATFPDGSHEGQVTLTQVPSTKVPMVAPRGGNFTLALTLQPPGIRFDPPAKITLPNTEGLAPGSELELFRFDHDLGEFVTAGVAQVSKDGRFVESPPGAGIVKSGWQAVADPQPPGNVCSPWACSSCGGAGTFSRQANRGGSRVRCGAARARAGEGGPRTQQAPLARRGCRCARIRS